MGHSANFMLQAVTPALPAERLAGGEVLSYTRDNHSTLRDWRVQWVHHEETQGISGAMHSAPADRLGSEWEAGCVPNDQPDESR